MDEPSKLPMHPLAEPKPPTPADWPWPPAYVPQPAPSQVGEVFKVAALGAASLLLISLAIGVLATMMLIAGTLASTGEALGGMSSRLDRSLEAARGAVTAAGQRLSDATDPTHPPREGVVQDTEIDSFRKVTVGEVLGEAGGYRFTLKEIRLREAASPAEYRQFAVIHRERLAPKARSVLGVPLPADREEADFYLDRGELFQIGPVLFKVNWVSASQQQLALTTLRYPDQAAGPIEFRVGGSGQS